MVFHRDGAGCGEPGQADAGTGDELQRIRDVPMLASRSLAAHGDVP